jgi:hypothetical protein
MTPTCPAWCTRQHDLHGETLLAHGATVLERQIGAELLRVGVCSTAAVDGRNVVGPHVFVQIVAAGGSHQIDPTTREALLIADALEMAGRPAEWLVEALHQAVALIDPPDPAPEPEGPHRWRVTTLAEREEQP